VRQRRWRTCATNWPRLALHDDLLREGENRLRNRDLTVIGIFGNRERVLCAVGALAKARFSEDEIGVALRGEPHTALEKQAKVAQGAWRGVVEGGVVGGLLGAVSGLFVPGVSPVVASGLLGTALAGAALGASTGAVARRLLGTLTGLGVPEDEACYYNDQVKAGRIIVMTRANGRHDEAHQISRQCGAFDVDTRPEQSMGGD
jgi:hypothetical protein